MQQTRRARSSSSSPPASSGVHAALIDLNIVGGVLAAAEVGVWQLSASGPLLQASPTALRVLGLREGEPLDPGGDALSSLVHAADRDRVAAEVARARAEAGSFALELRFLAAGETRWIAVHGTSVHEASGFAYACGTVQDVTARKEQELFRELLLVTLSHDLRNPLTAIQIGAGLLLRRGKLGESDSSTAQRVLASAVRISAMVEQLLDFTRIRVSGALPCVRRNANLGILAAKAVHEVEREHPGSRIEMATEGDLDGAWDVDRVGQMIANLLLNAVAHGDAESAVTLRLVGRSAEVKLTIHNFGPRIETEEVDTIFNPFERSAPPPGRSGLGLFIAHEIVRAHGGVMRASSTTEEGTRFSVALPRAAPPR